MYKCNAWLKRNTGKAVSGKRKLLDSEDKSIKQ